MWLLAAYRRTRSLGRLAWSEGRWPHGAVPYSSHEPGELSVALSYDDSTINIVVVIIIIIIIIIIINQLIRFWRRFPRQTRSRNFLKAIYSRFY